jgi:hypothetical protein
MRSSFVHRITHQDTYYLRDRNYISFGMVPSDSRSLSGSLLAALVVLVAVVVILNLQESVSRYK